MRQFGLAALALAFVVGGVFAGGQGEDTTGTMTDQGFNATGFPIVDQPVTLTYVTPKHPLSTEIESMPLWQAYAERTNVIMDMEIVSSSGWNEKRNLLLASGDLPDILGNIPDTDMVRYSAQGFFLPLGELVDQYAPNVQALFEQRPQIERALRLPDGQIYGLPRINELRFRELPDLLSINKAWLDRVGLDIPTTIDEFEEALIAFRDNDVNQNGDPDDEIPFTFVFDDSGLNTEPWSLFGMFGTLENEEHRMVRDGTVYFTPLEDEWKEAMKWMRSLYVEELIDQEVFTHNRSEYFAKGKSGEYSVYGAFFEWFGPVAVGQERYEREYVVMAPMKGPRGDQLWNRTADSYFAGKSWFVITEVNEHPAVTMRWFDGIYEPEFSLEWSRGPFGTNLRKNADGSISFIDPPDGLSYNEFRFSNAPGGATGWAVLNDLYDVMELDATTTKKLKQDWPMYAPYLVEEAYPSLFFTEQEAERISILQTDIDSYVQQMKAKWLIGEEDIDATWDEFKDQLERMGVQELVDIWQGALDRYRGL